MLHGSPTTQVTDIRINSFMRRVSDRLGSPVREIVADTLTEIAAVESMAKFLAGSDTIDGLYAITDGMALGAYHAIKQAGLTIPTDIAIVGAGDYDFSALFDPPLTTVGADPKRQGAEAVHLLLDLIHQRLPHNSKIVNPVETRPRASVSRA